jgi:hypothetical protein
MNEKTVPGAAAAQFAALAEKLPAAGELLRITPATEGKSFIAKPDGELPTAEEGSAVIRSLLTTRSSIGRNPMHVAGFGTNFGPFRWGVGR